MRIKDGTVPYVPKTIRTESKSLPTMAWPPSAATPPHNLWAPLPPAVFQIAVYRTVLNLVNAKSTAECRQDEEAELIKLCVDVPELTRTEVETRQQAIDMAKEILKDKIAKARRSNPEGMDVEDDVPDGSSPAALGIDIVVEDPCDESSQSAAEDEIDDREAPSVGSQDSANSSPPSYIASSDAPSFASTLYEAVLYSEDEAEAAE